MAEAKRYYWLRLHDDFFSSKRIKKLRRLAGGDTLTIIYLKMQLLSIKTDGILTYSGLERTFAEELALDLDEDAGDVQMCLAYLASCGLIETSDNVSFLLPYAVENTGSEGSSAKRVREFRERKSLQCNADVTQVKQICNGESKKEIEIEKEINQSIKERDSISMDLTDGQIDFLDQTYENLLGLIDLIDERLKGTTTVIQNPLAYITSVAKAERWQTK